MLVWIEFVHLLGPDSQDGTKRLRIAAYKSQASLIHPSAPVGGHERSTAFHKLSQPFGNPSAKHVEHWGDDDVVALQRRNRIDDVNLDTGIPEGRIVAADGSPIHAALAPMGSCGVKCPRIFPIINERDLRIHRAAADLMKVPERFTQL